jgi:hypothetical protein
MLKFVDLLAALVFVIGLLLAIAGFVGSGVLIMSTTLLWTGVGMMLVSLLVSYQVSHKSCPKCDEKIKRRATVCKHCGAEIKPA